MAVISYPDELGGSNGGGTILNAMVFTSWKVKPNGVDALLNAGSVGEVAQNFVNAITTPEALAEKFTERDGSIPEIQLYVPNDMSENLDISYEDPSLGFAVAVKDIVERAVSGFESNGVGGALDAVKQSLGRSAITFLGGSLGALLQSNAGVTFNPHQTLLFRQMNLRQFSFTFDFSPKNQNEANNVQDIIKSFKLGALPRVQPNAAELLQFPNQWEFKIVRLHSAANTNAIKTVTRSKRLVITNVATNYAAAGKYVAFGPFSQETEQVNGQPAHVSVTVTFKETSLLTRDNYENYYNTGSMV